MRTEVSGFIDQIFVQNGQLVNKGDLLLTLRNDDIAMQHADLQLQIEQETIRHQTAMQEHDAGTAMVSRNNLVSLQDRLQETAQQKEALQIRASAAGEVVAHELQSRLHIYVKEGADLLVVDDKQSRELRISVAQGDFPLARKLLNGSVPVRLGTRPPITGVLNRVIPRASRSLFEKSLAATEGGSLAVTAKENAQDESDALELTEQRFEAVVQLAKNHSGHVLPVGERGYVSLGSIDKSLAAHLYSGSTDWLLNQIDIAKQTAGQ